MKKSVDTGGSVNQLPKRFNGWGVLLASMALTTFIFTVVGPVIERNSHLEALEDLKDQERLKRGLLMLCNTKANIKHLNEQLENKSLESRNKITRVASQMDCIKELKPGFQAEHYLWNGNEGEVSSVVAQDRAAIEPAIEALESAEAAVRTRAAYTLVALRSRLNEDHHQRIERRLEQDKPFEGMSLLQESLGLNVMGAPPKMPVPENTKLPEVVESAPESDMGEPTSDMDADMSDMDEHDAGALELKAPVLEQIGVQSEGIRGGLRLTEPSLQIKEAPPVLYQANEGQEVEGGTP